MQNISIKKVLMAIPAILIIAFVFLYFTIASSIDSIQDKSQKASLANKIIKLMLEARVAEKNYIRRKDEKYAKEVMRLIEQNIKIAKKLKAIFTQKENQKLVERAIQRLLEYKKLFYRYARIRNEAIKKEHKLVELANRVEEIARKIEIIQNGQRDSVIRSHKASAQEIIDEVEEAALSNKIIIGLMRIRIAEKNYLRRKNDKYIKEISTEIAKIKQLANQLRTSLDSIINKKMVNSMMLALQKYENTLEELIKIRNSMNTISYKMKNAARKTIDSLVKLREDQKKEKEALIQALKIKLTIIFIIVGLIISALLIFVALMIGKNLDNIRNAAQNLASGEGDLTKRIDIEGKNEISQVAFYINKFIEKVQSAIGEAKNVSNEASSISNELSATSLEIGKRVEDESSLVKVIDTNAKNTAKDATFVESKVREMTEISESSYQALNDAVEHINTLVEKIKYTSIEEGKLSNQMKKLQESAFAIKDILKLIGDIADQTNLLSLNASIEASRAGEHGKGFAVVAEEVRKLAEKTQKNLEEINKTINSITTAIEMTSKHMQSNANEVMQTVEIANVVETNIGNVIHLMEDSKEKAKESSISVDNLKEKVAEIAQKINQLNEVSMSNARSVEEIASAAEHLNNIIEKLDSHLFKFKS
ncbi:MULTISPECIES: methyl-accepting chemotaxis protein [unclassified Nitratiruptor]|uniref:methyl-accepting chemotaxis protein n=1 Tax=unclassified Nitratiruptor TaxID=2624044 RepID=UPI0019166514|nr:MULTISPECIES: methyl-accepting chemotaxis protein [unclassified Nitratiruptor]BCD60367.1 methyl-accepting chemotaxis protein [Nitratiruptor sp. YY08-10]BCD64144.1 methyl-accepting chemotaxis protein [Nitratiruptor sp. YY08-14]